jgi:hypothetical protein
MTDDEYQRFLSALAAKHRNYLKVSPDSPPGTKNIDPLQGLRTAIDEISSAAHLFKIVRTREEPDLAVRFVADVKASPVRRATRYMEASGILDALDDAPSLILGELRRSAIPWEDEEFLRRAGFDADEIEVFLSLAVERAHVLASDGRFPSDIAEEAAEALDLAVKSIPNLPPGYPSRKKRKIFNGIGKLLGGAVAGIGNVLLATGTLAAPNPATGYAAIASGGVAIASFFGGIGDLNGE